MIVEKVLSDELCRDIVLATYGMRSAPGLVRHEGFDVAAPMRSAVEHAVRPPSAVVLSAVMKRFMLQHPSKEVAMAVIAQSYTTELRLLSYEVGCGYAPHTDRNDELKRIVSCTLALNDDYEGGELYINGMPVKLRTGEAVVFESTTVHEVRQVTNGVRWAAVGFIREEE